MLLSNNCGKNNMVAEYVMLLSNNCATWRDVVSDTKCH